MKEQKTEAAKTEEYHTPDEIKELMVVELDILEKFKQICQKYNLTFYAGYGTLLGAIRHKGFIPWDDDLDVVMLYDDYQKLLEISEKENDEKYFFQSHLTETVALPNVLRFRRSDTTACTEWEYEFYKCVPDYNRGICMDIFPLFNLPESAFKRWIQRKIIMLVWKIVKGYDGDRNIKLTEKSKLRKEYEKYVKIYRFVSKFITIDKIKKMYLNCCNWEKKKTKYVAALSIQSNNEHFRYEREWFDSIVYLPFENTKIPCPTDYANILETTYGDWQTPKMGTAWHTMKYINAHLPYSQNPDITKTFYPQQHF